MKQLILTLIQMHYTDELLIMVSVVIGTILFFLGLYHRKSLMEPSLEEIVAPESTDSFKSEMDRKFRYYLDSTSET